MAKKTNCIKNGIPYYRVSAVVGHKENGSPIRKEFYGSCKAEAENARDDYLSSLKSANTLDPNKMRVGILFKYWMYQVKRVDSSIKKNSFSRYESAYRNHIAGADFLTLSMAELNSRHIQTFLNSMMNKECTHSQIKETYKVLRMFLNYAVAEGYFTSYPCKNVVIPGNKPVKEKIITFTNDEIQKIMNELTGHRLRLLYLMALHTGMRLGELLALRYDHIQNGLIHIDCSLSAEITIDQEGNRQRKLTITTPKTDDSVRVIPFPIYLKRELDQHRKRQIQECLSIGIGKPNLIFTTITGKMIDPTNISTAHTRLLKRAGVPHKKFHTYRHTYGTEQIKHGTDIKTLQELMGHSDITITMIYLHPDMETKKKASKVLKNLYTDMVHQNPMREKCGKREKSIKKQPS